MNDDGLLAEQRAYYRARASEYDEWWQRRGRFDRGPELAQEWDREVAQMAAALETFGATGDVLELAGGTGWWTARLARTAGHLTVIDSSPESLELSRTRVARPDVDYLVADLITWRPLRTYDVVFFSFWLSHVPRSRFSAFWSLVRSCLAPGGRVFLIDNRNESHQTGEIADSYVIRRDSDLELRRVHDGREFQVVEIFYEPEELRSLLDDEGWTARLDATRWFIFGEACLADTRQPARRDAAPNAR
ncbi:MAG: class I SAM-dependent methyltransferase [Actinomycetota bacterium]|nr:class I SAM-dependent methyltransferase [Actinomycetota bacterium]